MLNLNSNGGTETYGNKNVNLTAPNKQESDTSNMEEPLDKKISYTSKRL